MRKNIAIWKHWTPLDGNGLHLCVRSGNASFAVKIYISLEGCKYEF